MATKPSPRLAVLSDIHGNLPALEAVLLDAREQAADGMIVAGDSVVGPQQAQVLRRLWDWAADSDLGSWSIRGNSEDYCLALAAGDAPAAWSASEQWATTRWAYSQLDRDTLGYLASLPDQCVLSMARVSPIRVVHGSPASATEHLCPEKSPGTLRVFREQGLLAPGCEPPPLAGVLGGVAEPVLVCGHSHIGWSQKDGTRLTVNAGSVGAPNNGDPRAQYALLDWDGQCWQATLCAVAYDLEQARAAWRESGLLAAGGAFARACLLAVETGHNVPGRFVAHAFRLASEAGYRCEYVVPDHIWDQAVATFGWENATAGRF